MPKLLLDGHLPPALADALRKRGLDAVAVVESTRTSIAAWRRTAADPTRSPLAPRRAYQVALRRAILAVGGQTTGSHAQRRTSAVEVKNAKYREHLKKGQTTKKARRLAVQDTVEHLGHGRTRKDLALAYLRA